MCATQHLFDVLIMCSRQVLVCNGFILIQDEVLQTNQNIFYFGLEFTISSIIKLPNVTIFINCRIKLKQHLNTLRNSANIRTTQFSVHHLNVAKIF